MLRASCSSFLGRFRIRTGPSLHLNNALRVHAPTGAHLCNSALRWGRGRSVVSWDTMVGKRHYSGGSGAGGNPFMNMNQSEGEEESALAKYTTDMTELAREHKLDPVVGRDDETARVLEILSRRGKNNPILIGEAGTGKTAIVEGLAQRIAAGDVPGVLADKRLLSLDLAALVAGSGVRGEFEKRFKSVVKEVEESNDVILFVDEAHLLVGAGSAGEGQMDAANLLKPALARKGLAFVGATTLSEFRKSVEKDPALLRRFQTVFIDEPSLESTISILRALKPKYELHHSLPIRDSAVVASAELAQRYITDRKFPDKAIDVLDEACARLRMLQDSKPEAIVRLEQKILTLKIEFEALKKETDTRSAKRRDEIMTQLKGLLARASKLNDRYEQHKAARMTVHATKEELETRRVELEKAFREGDLSRASELRYSVIPALEQRVEEEAARVMTPAASSTSDDEEGDEFGEEGNLTVHDALDADDIAYVIARQTAIPVSKLLLSESERLLKMEEHLQATIVGQDAAVQAVANAVRVSRAGLHPHNKPVGSFLFLGPSGVGKTQLCKATAEFLFDDEDAVLRIDMSEYLEKHSVSRLIGSPPGYVGHEEGGVLTESVRRRPYQLVLFDEIEKAHPAVTNVLLQVLDEGHLTDSLGRKVDFRNTLIVMTSNLGARGSVDAGEDLDEQMRAAAASHFAPEFLNRIDEITCFNRLERSNMEPIVRIQLKEIERSLERRNNRLEMSPEAIAWLADKGLDPRYGARPLKREMKRSVLHPLSLLMLEGEITEGYLIRAGVKEDQSGLEFEFEREEE